MNEMDANIMLHPRGERKGVYSGKLFDYISAQKPIIACVDKNDVAAELIYSFDCTLRRILIREGISRTPYNL